MRPICRRRKIASFVWSRAQISVPSTSTWPELGVSTPPRMCSRVDLPEPEGPTMATNSPFSTLKLTSSMALICVSSFPYIFERLFTLRISTTYLQDFYNTNIHSIRRASDPAVTAIVTIYSRNRMLGCKCGLNHSAKKANLEARPHATLAVDGDIPALGVKDSFG